MAAISALFVLWFGPQWMGMPLSQAQPPKKCADTWQLGTATATRSSTAERRKVWVCAARVSRHADALRIDAFDGGNEVHGADAVPHRHAQNLWHFGMPPARAFCVAVADHVVMKDDGAHAGEHGDASGATAGSADRGHARTRRRHTAALRSAVDTEYR